jgi:hypothetical protein
VADVDVPPDDDVLGVEDHRARLEDGALAAAGQGVSIDRAGSVRARHAAQVSTPPLVYYGGGVARIRIIDEWLRSPVSSPSRHRAVMVVAESWSEQRVLMRAFSSCSDQTRPTIVLHGHELAIGPAGTDPHGQWGIHVEPPVDGRAQELRSQLELAARRLAGSKGNPPRLVDETSRFDNKATHLWAPGSPPDPIGVGGTAHGFGYYEPAVVAPPSESPVIPSAAPRPAMTTATRYAPLAPVSDRPTLTHMTPMPQAAPRRSGGKTDQHWVVGSRTQPGFVPASPATAPMTMTMTATAPTPTIATLVGKTMPLGLQLSDSEREVLNALARAPSLTAREIAAIAKTGDALAWMEAFMRKLAGIGLDLVAPGDDADGEPTYVLRR